MPDAIVRFAGLFARSLVLAKSHRVEFDNWIYCNHRSFLFAVWYADRYDRKMTRHIFAASTEFLCLCVRAGVLADLYSNWVLAAVVLLPFNLILAASYTASISSIQIHFILHSILAFTNGMQSSKVRPLISGDCIS